MKTQIHNDVAGLNIGRVWLVWSRFGGAVPVDFRVQRIRMAGETKYRFWRINVAIADRPEAIT
jgi:hypothetical protein